MAFRKALFHASIAPVLICVMMGATYQAREQAPESESQSRKNADLAREIEQLRAELERTRAQVASLTKRLESQVLVEKQKQREQYLNLLRRDLLERTRQLEDAHIQLARIAAQEKSLEKAAIPPDKLSTLLNHDAVIKNSLEEIARLQDVLAEYMQRSAQPETEAGYKRAVAQIEKLEKSVQARKEKIRPHIEKDWRDSIRESLGETRDQLKDQLALLTASTRKLEAQFENAAKQIKQQSDGDQRRIQAQTMERLQAELNQARAQLEELKQRLELERNRALHAAREAAAQRDALRQAEARARQQAEQALAAQAEAQRAAAEQARLREMQRAHADQMRAAREALAKQKEEAMRSNTEAAPFDLEPTREKIKRRFDQQREDLMVQLKHLDEEQRRVLADLGRRAQVLRESGKRQGEPGKSKKLDQILEQLQRIEMRLEQLERNPRRAPGQPK